MPERSADLGGPVSFVAPTVLIMFLYIGIHKPKMCNPLRIDIAYMQVIVKSKEARTRCDAMTVRILSLLLLLLLLHIVYFHL